MQKIQIKRYTAPALMFIFCLMVILSYTRKVNLQTVSVGSVDHFAIAQENHRAHHYEQAISEYQEVLKTDPQNFYAHYNLALIYSEQSRLADSLAEFNEAKKLNPDMPDLYLNLGLLYHKFNLLDDAVREYSTILRINPNYGPAYYNLGVVYYQKNMIADSIAQYLK